MTIAIVRVVADLPADFNVLRQAASLERHTHMERLGADWANGVNRFDAPGEALMAAFLADALAGIGGMTVDPVEAGALRMRRFYVLPAFRRHGIGRSLAQALLEQRGVTQRVVLNAETVQAARFWEALGFMLELRDGHTHALHLSD